MLWHPGWPIVRSIFHVNKLRPDLSLIAWGRELGPVYAVKMFNVTLERVTGYDAIIKTLITKDETFRSRAFG